MIYNKKEIKKGITLSNIETDKFKTNLVAIFLTTPLTREYVTYDSMLSSVLRRGSKTMPTQEEISKKMEEMYGANFNNGLDKTGDNHILKFYIESINDEFIPEKTQNLLKESIEKLSEIVFNPYLENDVFKKEYIEQEKENVKRIIEGKIDNKALYAKFRCIEEMYKGEPAGLYRFGYIEDLEKINAKNLFEYYKKLLNECKIDIFISGKIKFEETLKIIENNENIDLLKEREPKFIINKIATKKEVEERKVEEKQDVTQGKVVIGCDILFTEEDLKNEKLKYEALVYNSLLRRKCCFKTISKCERKSKFGIYGKFKL